MFDNYNAVVMWDGLPINLGLYVPISLSNLPDSCDYVESMLPRLGLSCRLLLAARRSVAWPRPVLTLFPLPPRWDTAGQDDFQMMRPMSYQNADIFLVFFAIDNPVSFQNVKYKVRPATQRVGHTRVRTQLLTSRCVVLCVSCRVWSHSGYQR